MPIVPADPKDKDRTATTLRLPDGLLEELREAATFERISLNELAIHLLRFAVDAWKDEKAQKRGKK